MVDSLLRAGKGSALYKYAGVLFHLLASTVLALFLPRVLVADDGTGITCQTLDSIAPNTLKSPYLIEGSRLCFRQAAVDNPATAQTFARPDHVWLWSFLKEHSASIVLPVKHQPEPADHPLLTDSSPASQSIPAILLKESLIPGDLPHRQHRKLGLKIEQALNDRQRLSQQFTHKSYQPMPTVAVSVRNAQVRMVISEEQAPRTINLLSFYQDHLDALIQSYLSLSDDETISKVFLEWASNLPASAASSGGGGDDDDNNNGSNQGYDDREPEPLILVYGEKIWPAQDSEQRLFSQSLENKRRLLKILKKKLRKAMAGGNADLIKILNNRIILVDVELGELERSGQSLSPAVLPLFKASFIPDYLEVQRYDEQTLSIEAGVKQFWSLIIPGSSAPRIGRQVPDSGTQKSKGGNASSKEPNTHSQRPPSTMKSGTESHSEDGNDGDGNHYHNRHTKNNNCPACNNGPCKEDDSSAPATTSQKKKTRKKKKKPPPDCEATALPPETPVSHRKVEPATLSPAMGIEETGKSKSLTDSEVRSLTQKTLAEYSDEGFTTVGHALAEGWSLNTQDALPASMIIPVDTRLFTMAEAHNILEYVQRAIKLPGFQQLKPADQINLLLAEIKILQYNGNDSAASEAIDNLLRHHLPESIQPHLEVLTLYRKIALTDRQNLDPNELNQLMQLAKKTRFIPAVSLLVREMLRPDNTGLLSPIHIPRLLSPNSESVTLSLAQVFCVRPLEARMIRADRDFFAKKTPTPYDIMAWNLSGLLGKERERLCPGSTSFPDEAYITIFGAFTTARAITHAGGQSAYRRIIANERRQSSQKGKEFLDRTVTNRLNSQKVIKRMKAIIPTLQGYPKSCLQLSLAFYCRHQSLEGLASPLDSAKMLLDAASGNHFSRLYLDAANLFMSLDKYEEAIDSLEKLKQAMPEYQNDESTENQAELCRNRIAQRQQNMADNFIYLGRYERAIESLEKLKQTLPEYQGSETINDQIELCHSYIERREQITRELLGESSLETPTPQKRKNRAKKGKKKSGEVSSVTDRTEPPTQPTKESTSKTAQTAATGQSSKEKAGAASQKKVTLPEQDKELSKLLGDINRLRDSFNIEQELELINTALNTFAGQTECGRVCEEAAWTYLRNAGIPNRHNRLPTPESTAKELDTAEELLCRALAEYTGSAKQRKMPPVQLKRTLEGFKIHHAEVFKRFDQRIRLRSICSSFGHLYNKKAMNTFGKQGKRLAEQAREFYQLKRVADPTYQSRTIPLPVPKVNVVSQEEADTIRKGMKE